MAKISAFEQVTLDGYFSGKNGDYSWTHEGAQDAEFNAFTEKNASGGGTYRGRSWFIFWSQLLTA